MARVKFIDVLDGGIGEYPWAINHEAEEEFGAALSITRTAPTSGVGFVRQLGDPQPLLRRLKGTILDRSQYEKMWSYFFICTGLGPGPQRTIHFVDQLGASFEGLITVFNPIAVRASNNPRGQTADEKLVYWTYDLTFEVINVVSGWPY